MIEVSDTSHWKLTNTLFIKRNLEQLTFIAAEWTMTPLGGQGKKLNCYIIIDGEEGLMLHQIIEVINSHIINI